MTAYRLLHPTTADQWSEYHRIRREVLFEDRGRVGVYDETHPHETAPDHHACLLLHEGNAVATARLDHDRATQRGILRLVAVDRGARGRGHGRELLRRVEHLAEQLGCRELVSNAASDATPWYLRHGFAIEAWDPAQPPRGDGVQVRKRLR
jgi:N-acetylglutamate synthase-like GNAT family acetyltransferase